MPLHRLGSQNRLDGTHDFCHLFAGKVYSRRTKSIAWDTQHLPADVQVVGTVFLIRFQVIALGPFVP